MDEKLNKQTGNKPIRKSLLRKLAQLTPERRRLFEVILNSLIADQAEAEK
jgi:hypothetical protein